MPPPEHPLVDSADIVLWFSKVFLDHKKAEHPTSQKIADDPILP